MTRGRSDEVGASSGYMAVYKIKDEVAGRYFCKIVNIFFFAEHDDF